MKDQTINSTNRRAFLKKAVGIGGALLASRITPALAAGRRAPWADQIGVQLYTLRDRMENDFEGTIETVAEIGYDEVEFAGYFDHSPEDVRALLDRLELTSPSTHIGLSSLREDLEGTLDAAATIGHRYLTIPSAPRGSGGTLVEDDWHAFAEEFNRIGTAARERDLRLAYHNHAFEFTTGEEGRTGFDVLLAETDPDLVSFELDLFWAVLAGQDPVELFERYPGRFALWHVKDLKNIESTRTAAEAGRDGRREVMQNMTAVGEGDIDFAKIFENAETSGLEHFFVENDAPQDSVKNVETSFTNLTALLS
jgi:sugar phosphate isomerase/epimerase